MVADYKKSINRINNHLFKSIVFIMRKFSLKYLGFVILLTAIGCTETIDDIQLDSTRARLVVEGYISTDTIHQSVKLSKLGDALMKNPVQTVSGAEVTVSDGTMTWNFIEDPNKKGTYLTDQKVYGMVGKSYFLKIKNVDINNDQIPEEYTAQSKIKGLNTIDSLHIVPNTSNPHFRGWSINLYTMDPGNGRNYYLIKVLKNNKLLTDSIFKYSIGDNTSFEGKYYDGFTVYNLREERLSERPLKGDTITLELYGITEDYYSFISAYIQDYYPKIPIFSGPSANIPSNIKPFDDAVGIFAAYSIKRKSVIYR
jgi:outer membrane lipoprotein-sorting protein